MAVDKCFFVVYLHLAHFVHYKLGQALTHGTHNIGQYMKQYSYTFKAHNGRAYTVVASRYSQARTHFMRVFSGFLTVVYNGCYSGQAVVNKTVVSIK